MNRNQSQRLRSLRTFKPRILPQQLKTTKALVGGFIEEPILVFGNGGTHVDPKFGLSLYGPYSLPGQSAHPASIGIGIVGTKDVVESAKHWIERLNGSVVGSDVDSLLSPKFPGMVNALHCRLETSDSWVEVIPDGEMVALLKEDIFMNRVKFAVNSYLERIKRLTEREPKPQVVICAMSEEVENYCMSKETAKGTRVPLSKEDKELVSMIRHHREVGQQTLFPLDPMLVDMAMELKAPPDFRRLLKAKAMLMHVPTQFFRYSTLINTGRQKQDDATIAWNLAVALHYKAGGNPWRLSFLPANTCYIGISFFKDRSDPKGRLRTSMAQIFSHTGEGLIFRGEQIQWASKRTPHLSAESAESLLAGALETYRKHHHETTPERLVIHKSQHYWPEELEGFRNASEDIPCKDFVAFGYRGVKFLRKGRNPPVRGSYVKIAPNYYALYTLGYIPQFKIYPGPHVPAPLEILEHIGETPTETICREILALTKLNWNSATFAIQRPITLAFSDSVGDILSTIPSDVDLIPEYRYYM